MDVADRCDGDGTIVAIHRWPRECHAVAKRLRGRFDCMEPIDSADLLTAATAIQVAQGVERVSQVAAFASQCLTKVEAELKTVLKVVETGRRRRGHTYKRQAQLDALLAVAEDESLGPVLPALDSIRAVSGTILYRRELFYEMRRALQSYAAGGYDTLSEAVWHARNRTRRHGRFTQRCVVGRTLLAKGLEFDHAVVLDAGKLDTKNLYVAMTRGTRSLTILSKAPVLRPNRRE
jgi:DNA helicase-2/ATP-dependent DNA helicase PcrA